MKNTQLCFWSWFNIPFDKSKTKLLCSDKWIENRFNHWKYFTYASIQNQLFEDWIYLLLVSSCNFEFTKSLFESVNDGKIFYAVNQVTPLLPQAKNYIFMRIDSDDAYRKDAASEAMQRLSRESKSFLLFNKCYVLDYKTKEIAIANRISPPFSAYFHPEQPRKGLTFSDLKGIVGHRMVRKRPHLISEGRKSMICLHAHNSGRTTNRRGYRRFFSEQVKNQQERDIILKEFGL